MNEIIINGVDQTVGNITTYAIGLYSNSSKKTFKWFLEKFIEKCQVLRRMPKLIVTEINSKLIASIQKLFKNAKILISHYSVIQEFKKIQSKTDVITIDDGADTCLQILQEICGSETKAQCRILLSELNKNFAYYDNYHQEFEDRIFIYKDHWLPYKFQNDFTAGMHSYTKLATIKEIFENSSEKNIW